MTTVDVLLEGDAMAEGLLEGDAMAEALLEGDGIAVAEGLVDEETPVHGKVKMETGWIPVDPVA